MTLAELIESGRATISVEEAASILEVGRCTAYEATVDGGFLADCTIRVGRRKVIAVPRLFTRLGVPLPAEWQRAAALSPRCHCVDSASDSSDLGSPCPKVDA